MPFSLSMKIFAISAAVLALMAVAAFYSIVKTAALSEDLRQVAGVRFPTAQIVGQINALVLEQHILLQRLLIVEQGALTQSKARHESLNHTITQLFAEAEFHLRSAPAQNGKEETLAPRLAAVKTHYQSIFADSQAALTFKPASDRLAALDGLRRSLDSMDRDIMRLREDFAKVSEAAITKASRQEHEALYVHIGLTFSAACLALLLSFAVSRLLVRALRRLVSGAAAVEQGSLDVAVPISTKDEVGLLTAAFNDMVEGLRLKERIKETFGKYMDPRIVSQLLDHPELSKEGGARRDMTVMFIDLKGFTSLSEALSPDDLILLINRFFSHMSAAIAANGGVVDKYMGDAVMAYWGPPFNGEHDHAARACQAAKDALTRLPALQTEVAEMIGRTEVPLDIDLRIGLSTGPMIVGSVGSEQSKNFTVMGDPVNLGSRLEGANKDYGSRILVSERTAALAQKEGLGKAQFRELDLLRVKGKTEPVRVYELASGPNPDDPLRDDPFGDARFAEALSAYRHQDWDRAHSLFALLQDHDPAAQAYVKWTEEARAADLPEDWDGVRTKSGK